LSGEKIDKERLVEGYCSRFFSSQIAVFPNTPPEELAVHLIVRQQQRESNVSTPKSRLDEDVTISVERMIRFCYLAEMQFEYSAHGTKILPLHLTRFGTLALETASFLHSLFEDSDNAINVLHVWQGFDHPFSGDLQSLAGRLGAFKEDLRLVRNRVGFHGSLNRSRERAGLSIFDVQSSRARDFVRLVRDIQQLFLRMIAWYVEGMDKSAQPAEIWREFVSEMRSYSVARGPA
jgi:hypothetical protein